MSYDLILQTRPEQELTSLQFEAIQKLIAEGVLSRLCEVAPGKFENGRVDTLVLAEGLDFGDFTEQEFAQFCVSRGFAANRNDPLAATAFVRSKFGFGVCTLKLPKVEEDARAAFSAIVEIARRHGLRVVDPQKGFDIDLNRPGSLPPLWS